MDTTLYQVLSGIVAALVFLVWVRPQTFRFLLDKGSDYPSLGRQGQYTALLASTWVFVTVTLKGGLAEWLFVGYIITWAGAQVASLWLKIKGSNGSTPPAEPPK